MSDSGMVAGSISLVAPELKQGQLPSPASDMYAFGGIMLWVELLIACLHYHLKVWNNKCVCVCVYIYVCVCICICMYICVYICICVCVCMCVCIYIYIYIYIY